MEAYTEILELERALKMRRRRECTEHAKRLPGAGRKYPGDSPDAGYLVPEEFRPADGWNFLPIMKSDRPGALEDIPEDQRTESGISSAGMEISNVSENPR
ncbi:hypothetical protein ECMP02155212_5477 [Escherichia coli MP021552.12]|nr:hypothetical protein ECMP02155212_5477 [Escherichia coli MP021552.12]